MPDTEMTKYLLKTNRDTFVIEILSSWKITFASVNPAANQSHSHCVRVYEMPGSKLRAVFDSVVSIRDLSIPLAKKVEKETGSSSWTFDSEAGFEEQKKIERESTYTPDTPNVEF